MARCKYGKLKNPVGGRRCKKSGVSRYGKRFRIVRRRRARRAGRRGGVKVRTPFILAGLAALGLLAYSQSQQGV